MVTVAVFVDLGDISISELIEEIIPRIEKDTYTNKSALDALENLKKALNIPSAVNSFSISEIMKVERMKKVLEKYTLKEIESALPV